MVSPRWLLPALALLALQQVCALPPASAPAPETDARRARALTDDLPDIDNNEVLPEVEVARAVGGGSKTPTTSTSTSTLSPTPTPTPSPSARPSPGSSSSAATKGSGAAAATTPETQADAPEAPDSRPFSSFSKFLTDLIQIPIAVMRSVGALLSSTFHTHSEAPTPTPAPAQPTKP